MRSLIVFSSLTGNTAKVARAIYDVLPEPREIHTVESVPSPDGFDFIAVGFWVDKGMPDTRSRNYLKTLKGKRVGLFGTLGADPGSDHARRCLENALQLAEGNTVLGTFLCQGRIDPKVVETMRRMAPEAHPMTPERMERIRAAETHPDREDLENAQAAFRRMIAAVVSEDALCAR